MAYLNKSVLGKVSGAVGDITFRQLNGKNYLATRPRSFMPGSDESSFQRRSRFRISVKFASAIHSIRPLKQKWDLYSAASHTTFCNIVKKVSPFITPNSISESISIVPSAGFGVPVESTHITSSEITIGLGILGTQSGIDINTETKISVAAVLYLSSPVSGTYEPYYFLPFLSIKQDTNIVNALSFEIPVNGSQKTLFEMYNTRKLFFCLLTYDAIDNPVRFSQTLVG